MRTMMLRGLFTALAVFALDLVDDLLPVGEHGVDSQLVVRAEELPVEEVGQLATVHREELRPRDEAELVGDATGVDVGDANHRADCSR